MLIPTLFTPEEWREAWNSESNPEREEKVVEALKPYLDALMGLGLRGEFVATIMTALSMVEITLILKEKEVMN